MKNRYFDEIALAVLLDPRRWRMVSSQSMDEHRVASPGHRRWMRRRQHRHPYPEVMIALEGKTVYGMDNQIYPCNPGSVFVFDPGQAHDAGYPPWTPAIQHLWISFVQDKTMARLLMGRGKRIRSKGSPYCLFDLKDTAVWRQGTSGTFDLELPPKLIRLRLLAVLANVVAALAEEGYRHPAENRRDAVQKQKIDAICRHIRETGGAGARLDYLAQIAGYSKFHFLRLFQQHTGRTIHDFVNQSRLRQVKTLRARGVAFKVIAAELGFSCPAAFSRWYRPFRNQS